MGFIRRVGSLGLLASILCSLMGVGCTAAGPAGLGGDDELDIPDFESFNDGKTDTGYVGSAAAEVEATLTGHVRVMLPNRTATDIQDLATRLTTEANPWASEISDAVTEQTKYARNTLSSQKLNLNLEGGSPHYTAATPIEGGLDVSYELKIESLVKFRELATAGLTIQDLVGRTIDLRLPLQPAGLYERVADTCATDADEPNGVVDPHELRADNYFFYFDPARTGCRLTNDDLVTATYHVESSVDAPKVYPEYDRLVADGRIDMTAIFGQIEHGTLTDEDPGNYSFDDFTSAFTRRGFELAEELPNGAGHRLEKRYAGGLLVSLTMYAPSTVSDDVPRETANMIFQNALRNSEIVYYAGHAFYGSLSVLDDPTVYPMDRYQIVFMDACWSYAYYTKQIFRNRATAQDPTGYANADVVNNTEPGITGSELTAANLWGNLFRGADAVFAHRSAAKYSWNTLVKYMNEHAEARANARDDGSNAEIYGVSGVTSNRFHP